MDVETITEHCLALPGARADDAWGTAHPVVRVGAGTRGTALAYLGRHAVGVRLGADRREADAWLASHEVTSAARPMAYVGRRGWTDLDLAEVADDVLRAAVLASYRLLVTSLPPDQQPEGWEQALQPEPEDEVTEVTEVGEVGESGDKEPEAEEPEAEVSGDEEPEDIEPKDDSEPKGDQSQDDVPQDDRAGDHAEPEDDEPEDDEPEDDEPGDDGEPEDEEPGDEPEEQLELDLGASDGTGERS